MRSERSCAKQHSHVILNRCQPRCLTLGSLCSAVHPEHAHFASHLFLLIKGEELKDVAAVQSACYLKRPADVVVFIDRFIIEGGGPGVPAIDQEFLWGSMHSSGVLALL